LTGVTNAQKRPKRDSIVALLVLAWGYSAVGSLVVVDELVVVVVGALLVSSLLPPPQPTIIALTMIAPATIKTTKRLVQFFIVVSLN